MSENPHPFLPTGFEFFLFFLRVSVPLWSKHQRGMAGKLVKQ